MFEKIDSVLDKVRNVSSQIQNISKYLEYAAKVVNHFGNAFANIPRFDSANSGRTVDKSQTTNE